MYDENGVWTNGDAQVDLFTSVRANIYNLITCDDDNECINILETILHHLTCIKMRMDDATAEKDNYRRRCVKAEIKNGRLVAQLKNAGLEVEE